MHALVALFNVPGEVSNPWNYWIVLCYFLGVALFLSEQIWIWTAYEIEAGATKKAKLLIKLSQARTCLLAALYEFWLLPKFASYFYPTFGDSIPALNFIRVVPMGTVTCVSVIIFVAGLLSSNAFRPLSINRVKRFTYAYFLIVGILLVIVLPYVLTTPYLYV